VGDEVKVEANVSAEGAVVALKVESSVKEDVISTPSAAASSTPDPTGTPSAPQTAANQNEVFGAVQALTASTITINGVTYNLSNSTEFKNALTVGDQVKLHVILNADGTFTVREVEKSAASFDDNSQSNGSDDGPNHDMNGDHSNDNSHDQSDDHGNDDSNDDHGGDGGNSGPGGD